jgi:sirohydrochlorin ferrochelatase
VTLLSEAPRIAITALAPALVGISHGTSSAAGQAAVGALVSAVAQARADLHVSAGFVDVQTPDVAATLGALETPDAVEMRRDAVVVPLLLSAGYHVHVDLRRELDAIHDRRTALAMALGPDDRLVALLIRRLEQSGLALGDSVVLACAGSSDPRAVQDCVRMGERLARALGVAVRVGFISAAHPRLPVAVRTAREEHPGSRVVVSTYLLAPGFFAELASTAGADLVSAPLLAAGEAAPVELVALVVDRYLEAVAREGLS